jgi:hypothetical protein
MIMWLYPVIFVACLLFGAALAEAIHIVGDDHE